MGISAEKFIEATGGFRITEPMTLSPLHAKTIQREEDKLKSGTLSPDERQQTLIRISKLKGLTSNEWRSYEEDTKD